MRREKREGGENVGGGRVVNSSECITGN